MKAVRGVQLAAKGVGDAFTGGRDLHQLLHGLLSTIVAVEAYYNHPCFARVLPEDLKTWAKSLCGEAREAHERLRLIYECTRFFTFSSLLGRLGWQLEGGQDGKGRCEGCS